MPYKARRRRREREREVLCAFMCAFRRPCFRRRHPAALHDGNGLRETRCGPHRSLTSTLPYRDVLMGGKMEGVTCCGNRSYSRRLSRRTKYLQQLLFPQHVTPLSPLVKSVAFLLQCSGIFTADGLSPPSLGHSPHTCVSAGMPATKFPSTYSRYPLDPSGQVVSATWCHAPSERLVLEDQP